MARILKENVRLLRGAFSKREWDLLRRNAEFQARLKSASNTLDDFERLARLGNDLVIDIELETRLKPQFRRTKKQSLKTP
jgi:hypothetical protein